MFASSYWLICLAVVTSAIKWHLIREPILNVRSFHRMLLMMRVLMHLRFTFWRAATQSFSVSNYEDEPKATSWRSPLSQQCRLLNQASEWASASVPGLVTNFVIDRPRDESPALNDQSSGADRPFFHSPLLSFLFYITAVLVKCKRSFSFIVFIDFVSCHCPFCIWRI